MYDHIHGELANITPGILVVRSFGVGYSLKISLASYSDLKDKPSVVVWTYLAVSETSMILYGFSTTNERSVFLALIGVNGVGPNTALTILSYMGYSEVEKAAAHENKAAFKAVKGVGEKLASQIILDLKGKFKPEEIQVEKQAEEAPISREESILAIMSLGFNKTVTIKAVDAAISAGETLTEGIVRYALKSIK